MHTQTDLNTADHNHHGNHCTDYVFPIFFYKLLCFFIIYIFPNFAIKRIFGIFFAVAMVFITILTRTKEITENNKLQEALEEFQKRKKEE